MENSENIMYLAFRFLARTDIFFYLILWLIVLLVMGTIAQKDIGLYMAQQLYFSSFIIWFGNILPLPGGYLTLIFISVGLISKLFLDKWKWQRLGTFTIHLGALLLLFGGFLTAQFSSEGFMVIKEGQSSDFITDYHGLELVITDKQGNMAMFSDKSFKQSKALKSEAIPFSIEIIEFCKNCEIDAKGGLVALPNAIKSEENRAGISIDIDGEALIIMEDMPTPPIILNHKIELRHKRTKLPFSIKLLDFEKQIHQGTSMARSYRSDVILQDNGLEWRSRIQMNAPLRYKGYTFYQSSFIDGGANAADTTVLAVVKNIGRLFPYISSIIMCIGLLIHLAQRLPPLMRGVKNCYILLCCGMVLLNPTDINAAQPPALNYESFARIAVLHEGRVKPLDSFARLWLMTFSGRNTISGTPAINWLAELLFDQNKAYYRPVFNIPNPDVLFALSLEWREGHRYSFAEISPAIKANIDMIKLLRSKDRAELTMAQSQLLDLHIRILLYFEISRSVSLILPDLEIDSSTLAEKLSLPLNEKLIYIDFMGSLPVFIDLISKLKQRNNGDFSDEDRNLIRLDKAFQRFEHDRTTVIFQIFPPQWKSKDDRWTSPWGVTQSGQGSPQSSAFLKSWHDMARSYRQNDAASWAEQSSKALSQSYEISKHQLAPRVLDIEYRYNSLNLFKYSMGFYIAAFIIFLFGYLGARRISRKLSLTMISAGLFLHFTGICARMYIMARPPVATLYESIIFVGLIAVFFALLLEWRGRSGVGILIGSIIGATLHFIGMKYAIEGDSMGMLGAVLDTNFWLATHVVTITIGYGCCFVAGLLAHAYLLMQIFCPKDRKAINDIASNMLGAALIALFFSILGTILGGIWADQSWGRFWGWDPKENGAMVICLWLIFLLHGRVAGKLKPIAFAAGMVLTNVIVALAWFGVNLLNVGLHSYGFTDSTAIYLALFTGVELLFVIIVWVIIHLKTVKIMS